MISPESKFGEYRGEHERESIREQVIDAQVNVMELYCNRFLGENEAETLMRALSRVQNQQQLEQFKHQLDDSGIEEFQRFEYSRENESLVRDLRASFQEKISLMDFANWQLLFREFIELARIRHGDIFQELLIKSWASRLLEKAYRLSYQEGRGALEFADDVANVLRGVSNLPGYFMNSGQVIAGKRQPSFLESAEATLERLALVEQLPQVLEKEVSAIIVGGSLSYGPFYNVRRNMDIHGGSDIDLICILRHQQETKTWKGLRQTELLALRDREEFIARAAYFINLQRERVADIMSQRFRAEQNDFTVSAHFIPPEFFSRMNDKELNIDLTRNEDILFPVRDYKAARFEHEACKQQAFDGETYAYEVPTQMKTEKGYISTLLGYAIRGGKYFPGIYQNLISPEFSVFYDATGTTQQVVDKFRGLVKERLNQERGTGLDGTLTKSHIRNRLFAPERYTD